MFSFALVLGFSVALGKMTRPCVDRTQEPGYGSINLISSNSILGFQFLLSNLHGGDYICSPPFDATTIADNHEQFLGFNMK